MYIFFEFSLTVVLVCRGGGNDEPYPFFVHRKRFGPPRCRTCPPCNVATRGAGLNQDEMPQGRGANALTLAQSTEQSKKKDCLGGGVGGID